MPSYPYVAHLIRGSWLTDGPLSEMLDPYVEGLEARRYKPHTIAAYLRCLAHFSYWVHAQHLSMGSLNHALVEHYIAHHLPTCTCPPPCRSVVGETRAALHHFLTLLPHLAGKDGAAATPLSIELARFGDHLRDTCGLAPQTILYRTRHVTAFLAGCFGSVTPKINELGTKDIDTFLEGLADRWKPASRKVICASLRSYFRYRTMLGDDTRQLNATLPTVANWPRRYPPKVLSDRQLEQFQRAFDDTPLGLRDYAIARTLLDMGLRGDEAAHLTLDTVDWRNGIVTLHRTKSQREQRLPLPAQTGKALVRYLQEGRPQTTSRTLFVRHRAPFGVPLSVAAIRNAMNRAFVRCGLADRFCNTHVLRRSAATRLQKAGVSIKAIADVLRHRDLNTARVYARVDLERLRAVAQPWPGGRS